MVDLIHVSFLVGQGLLVLDSDFHHVLLELFCKESLKCWSDFNEQPGKAVKFIEQKTKNLEFYLKTTKIPATLSGSCD